MPERVDANRWEPKMSLTKSEQSDLDALKFRAKRIAKEIKTSPRGAIWHMSRNILRYELNDVRYMIRRLNRKAVRK